MDTKNDVKKYSQNDFNLWLDNVLKVELPSNICAYDFIIYESGDNLWSISLTASDTYDENDSDWACNEIFTSENLYVFENVGDWKATLKVVEKLVKGYLSDGKYKDKIMNSRAITYGFDDEDLNIAYENKDYIKKESADDSISKSMDSILESNIDNIMNTTYEIKDKKKKRLGVRLSIGILILIFSFILFGITSDSTNKLNTMFLIIFILSLFYIVAIILAMIISLFRKKDSNYNFYNASSIDKYSNNMNYSDSNIKKALSNVNYDDKYLKVIEKFKEKTKKECYKINLLNEETTILDNKIGGMPYLPVGEEYPKDSDGNYLRLLLQINLKEVKLTDFPSSGILEIFTSSINTEDIKYFVKCYKEGLKYQTELPDIDLNDFIVTRSYKIDVSKTTVYMPPSDFRFDDIIKKLVKDIYKVDIANYSEYNEVFNNVNWCDAFYDFSKPFITIGGYGDFTQEDPRIFDNKDKTECLFKIDSFDNTVFYLGDGGIISFLITKEDLKNSNFNNILVHFDCL